MRCLSSFFVLLCVFGSLLEVWHLVKPLGATTDLSPLVHFVNVQLYLLTGEIHVA